MSRGMERAPRRWVTSDPWTGLALAIVLQAKQDVRHGAKLARRYLSQSASEETKQEARRGMARCRAGSAVAFFFSPMWYMICEFTDAGIVALPEDLMTDVKWIRRAIRHMKRNRGKVD